MRRLRPIEIIGGGPAGMAAGILLRMRDVPVRLHDATGYPRHRVCGEFLCGLDDRLAAKLGLREVMVSATRNRTCQWMRGDGRLLHQCGLPDPVAGVTRLVMDQAMAGEFVRLGGELIAPSRAPRQGAEARVLACGRPATPGAPWSGLKAHFVGLPMDADLEVHLGTGGYVGLARLAGGRVNACGLFPTVALAGAPARAGDRLASACRAIRLDALADRLEACPLEPGSVVGCTRFALGWQPVGDGLSLAIGDALAIVPPFTGHGVTMAIDSAATAVESLVDYSRGAAGWSATVDAVRLRMRQRFGRRLFCAGWIHPALLHPGGSTLFGWLGRSGLLPFDSLYRLTHGTGGMRA